MFTTGSKFFVGASVLSLIGTLIYGMAQGGTVGTIGLVSVTCALMLIAGINFWVRDSTVSSMDTPGIVRSSAASRPPANSMWPLIGGFGAALLAVGLVTGFAITWMALIILLVVTFEWLVQAWSERASADPAYNASIRQRLLHPIEFPVLAAVGLGAIIFAFSRIVLYLPTDAGSILFGALGLVVLLFGTLFAMRRNVGRKVVALICAVGGLGIVGAGVASALAGSRHMEKHENATYAEGNCGEEEGHADEHASQAIAAKSNLTATIILEGGTLRADVHGIGTNESSVTLARSNPAQILFKNLDEEPRRLVADLGFEVQNVGTDTESKLLDIHCTQMTRDEGVQFLSLTPKRASLSAETPYAFTVPGVEGATVEIVVP